MRCHGHGQTCLAVLVPRAAGKKRKESLRFDRNRAAEEAAALWPWQLWRCIFSLCMLSNGRCRYKDRDRGVKRKIERAAAAAAAAGRRTAKDSRQQTQRDTTQRQRTAQPQHKMPPNAQPVRKAQQCHSVANREQRRVLRSIKKNLCLLHSTPASPRQQGNRQTPYTRTRWAGGNDSARKLLVNWYIARIE
jgi:hypothetical protein